MSDLTYSIYSIDAAPIDSTLLHDGAQTVRLLAVTPKNRKLDVKRSRCSNCENPKIPILYLPRRPTLHPTIIRRISEAVTPKMLILWRMSLLSSRLAYRRRRCQNFNETDRKEGFCRESSTSSSTSQNPNNKRASTLTLAPISNAVRPYAMMQFGATSLEKTIFKKCYVTDGNINLLGLDWIDELNLIQFPDENETCQTLNLELPNAENLVRGCDQYLYVVEIPYPSIHIQSLKPNSPRTLL
ncbi:hypothetical protein ACTXT7_000955 [Hymenolepis weldensis]